MDVETARVGIEFIYSMREHWIDLLITTVWALAIYASVLWLRNKLDK